jgi:hypothetical protein
MTRLCNGYDDGGQSPKLRVKKVEISQKALSLALEDMMIVISDMLNSSIVSVFTKSAIAKYRHAAITRDDQD